MTTFSFRPPRKRRITVLNVITLVDVMFVLLLFLLMTTTFQRAGSMKLDLPKSTTAEPLGAGGEQQEAELVLRADGTVLVARQPVTPSDLPARLQQIRAGQPDGRIMVKAEAGARHGDVVHLLDLVREAGFAGVGIGTEVPMGGVQK